MSDAPIPLVDLSAQHREVEAEVTQGFARVMASSAYILGRPVGEFEEAFARFSGVRHCVGVASGGDALELMLRAAEIGPGHEVLVPANTFIATALAVVRAGATPVPIDCDAHHLMDPAAVEARITPRTRALLPVHLYGQTADMEALDRIAARHGLVVLEDAAQAHGARRHGRAAGSLGLAAAFSFYPGKNLGAYGDAGAVLTSSDELAQRLRRLRNWGSDRKYDHPEIGFNSRLDTLQAVVLSAKLAKLAAWNVARRDAAARYDRLLADVQTPATLAGNEHVYHLYVVRVPRRDAVLERLKAQGIEAGVHYPLPLHLHGALRFLGYAKGDFPVAERAADEVLSLPLYPHLTAAQQERVAGAVAGAVRG